jgi:hypothetical protein
MFRKIALELKLQAGPLWVPQVRTSVPGPKLMGGALQTLLLYPAKTCAGIIIVFLLGCFPAGAQSGSLVGAWKAVAYEIAGVSHPMHGLFLFTPHFYSANVRFRLAEGPLDDANGNAGPYQIHGDEIVFEQWVQVHVRPEDKKQPVLSHEGTPEHSKFHIDGKQLSINFPSGNRYLLERATE